MRGAAVALVAVLALAAACGGGERSGSPSGGAPSGGPAANAPAAAAHGARGTGPHLEHDGISITLPESWQGRVLPLDYPAAVVQAANFEFAPPGIELPRGEVDPIKAMTAAHALVSIAPCGIASHEEPPRPAPARLSLDALSFLSQGHPRLPRGHAFAHGSFDFSSRCLRVEADFGSEPPDPVLAEQVNAVLGSLTVGAGAVWQSFEDAEAGLAGPLPEGWYVIRGQLTSVAFPRQVLALASFPLRQDAPDPECIPATAHSQLPREGAVILVLDYGDAPEPVAAEFPPRPVRFRLSGEPVPYGCYGLGYALRFSDGGRQLQVQIILGAKAGRSTLEQLSVVLDGLHVTPAARAEQP